MALSSVSKQTGHLDTPLGRDVGSRIRAVRQLRGMTQADVGHPYSRAYVSLVERGRTLPSLPALLHIAARLEVDPCSLLPSRANGPNDYTARHDHEHALHRASPG